MYRSLYSTLTRHQPTYDWIGIATTIKTSSYPGWIKSPHVVNLGIQKIPGGGYFGVNFGHPKSEVFFGGGILE